MNRPPPQDVADAFYDAMNPEPYRSQREMLDEIKRIRDEGRNPNDDKRHLGRLGVTPDDTITDISGGGTR